MSFFQTPLRSALAALLLLAPGLLQAEKKAIVPKGSATAGPYSPGIISGNTMYVAGQIGRDANGGTPEVFEDEVKACIGSIEKILKEAGLTLADAVAVQVYLTDMDLFDRMNKVYMTQFPEPRPARTTVGVAKLVGKARIEITVTADASKAKK
ncbi:RidA family protein [Bryobacter aggregatus]|uniref:RidA family protein n=1 Tax=Bryobacter aggregatus TaxID=360054 RepID=UPI0004E1E23D|nr:RidA family protein [Bryobacter aggregatus]